MLIQHCQDWAIINIWLLCEKRLVNLAGYSRLASRENGLASREN